MSRKNLAMHISRWVWCIFAFIPQPSSFFRPALQETLTAKNFPPFILYQYFFPWNAFRFKLDFYDRRVPLISKPCPRGIAFISPRCTLFRRSRRCRRFLFMQLFFVKNPWRFLFPEYGDRNKPHRRGIAKRPYCVRIPHIGELEPMHRILVRPPPFAPCIAIRFPDVHHLTI